MLAKILMLVFFICVTVFIGLKYRNNSGAVDDFVLGGREIGPWITAFAYGTAYFSAVVFIGYAGQFGWTYGISATWIGIGNALIGSLLAWVVLGRRTRIMTNHFHSATMPDFFAKRYQSETLRIVVSAIIFIFLVPYSASVYKGLSGLFSMAFGIDYNYCILGIAILTALYVILGGYRATAFNDFFQGIIMLVGIIAVVVGVLNANGGFMASLTALSQVPAESAPEFAGAFASFFGPDPLGLLSVIILTSLGTWGLPQMVHKFYTIRNEKAIEAGTIISTLFALIIAGGSYFMGGFGRLFPVTDASGAVAYDSIVPNMLAQSLPDIIIGLVIILVLSASMSTLASLVIASSSTLTVDFIKSIFAPQISEKKQVFIIRLFCAVFVVISVLLAINPNSLITSLMSLSWGTLAGCFLGPFLYGLFLKGVTKSAVWSAIIASLLINVGNLIGSFTSPIKAGALSMIVSLLIVPLISKFTPKMAPEHIEKTFSCYEEKVYTARKYRLADKNGNGK